ncbi:MAG TPA: bifunctional diguanylate cyclase/phosphodiesterase [Gallionellaceae bacterium]|nr:bifunctional diguanylate cyclase/phosphodiesterase [Gallionellaceae bacterium]
MSTIFKKILVVYLLVLALGVTLSTLIYSNGHSVSRAISSLVNDNLPHLNSISKLRVAIFAQKPLLYEYYATTDRKTFLHAFELNQREIEASLHTIHTLSDGNALLQKINAYTDQINLNADQLDRTFTTTPIDWDRARDILAEVSVTEGRVSPIIDALVTLNQQQVFMSGENAQSRTDLMIRMVIGFSLVISVIAILIGYQVNAYLSENAERKRLAMFPERNPSPVLRMTWEGKVVYSNPATQALLSQLQFADPAQLLPDDFIQRLSAIQSSGQGSMALEYTIKDRVIDCFVHVLEDLNISHIYINDITQRKQAEEKLLHQAYHDPMTGLPNRRMFNEHLQNAIREANGAQMIAVTLVRIDRIKLILESQGYEASDNLMQTLALRLKDLLHANRELAKHAFLFRFEGATFGILLRYFSDSNHLLLLAEKLHESMNTPLKANGQELFFTLSIGASVFPVDGHDPENLSRNAEAAVNRVIASGGNSFQCYTQDMNEMAERWLAMENGLRRALERNELVLLYQPQINVASNAIIGAEALLRWNRDGQGFVSPADFIPLAEETGLIIPIGEWVLRTACHQAQAIHQLGHTDFVMAVNISARQFQHPGFTQLVALVLQETGLSPTRLELEITESLAMHDAEKSIATMVALRTIGIQLSIDDFGTGYSSLSYLKRFPINKLKVDQSFVRNMCSNANDASIAKSVILLGQSLNLTVIAEGVETHEQLALLKQYGCDEVQGYLFSKPVHKDSLEQFISKPHIAG